MTERTRNRPRPGETVTVERAHAGKVYDRNVTEGGAPPPRDENKQWSRVRIGGGVTRNMGDYESIRVEVSVEMAGENTWEGVRQLTDELSEYVEEVIISEMDRAMGVQPE